MNDWQNDPERAAVEHIAGPLRAPMQLDETFDVRVMSAVHAEGLARVDAAHRVNAIAEDAGRSWWRRSYTLRVSPIGGLAMAAGIFGLMLVGSTALGRIMTDGPQTAPAGSAAVAAAAGTEKIHFVFVDGSAQQVSLVGDFNGWSKNVTPLSRDASGNAWAVSVDVPSGRHEYAFIVNDGKGERWIADPRANVVRDEFGTESSILHVGLTEEVSESASF